MSSCADLLIVDYTAVLINAFFKTKSNKMIFPNFGYCISFGRLKTYCVIVILIDLSFGCYTYIIIQLAEVW